MPEEQFFSLLTDIGAAQLTNAVALAQTIDITEMAVGSGEADAYYEPTEAQAALKTEVFRGPINNRYVHPDNANWVVFELAIPAVEGPFTVREAAVFDDAGNMIGIMKAPETYKPALAQGAAKDLLYRFVLQTSNAAQVELLVDPGVVLATHTKVEQDIANHEAAADPHDQYNVPQATVSVVGKSELADIPETLAGLDATRAVTPAGLDSVISAERKHQLLERLLSAMEDSNTNPAMNAKPETYETTDGLDLAASSNITHDATTASINNSSTTVEVSSAGEWEGATGSFTFTGDDVQANGVDKGVRSIDLLTGDFEVSAVLTNTHNFAIYDSAEDATFNENGQGAGVDAMGVSFHFTQSLGQLYKGGVSQTSISFSNGDKMTFRRTGSTISVEVNDGLVYTYAGEYNGSFRAVFGVGNASPLHADVTWTVPGPAVAATEVSNAIDAFVEPVTGYYLALIEPVDAIVYDVDLTADLSKNDGATWEDVPLTKISEETITVGGVATTVDLVFGEVNFATVGAQAMRRRVLMPDGKLVIIHASIFDAE